MLGYAGICWDMLGYVGYVGICGDIVGYVRICWDILGYAGICWDMLGYARICFAKFLCCPSWFLHLLVTFFTLKRASRSHAKTGFFDGSKSIAGAVF